MAAREDLVRRVRATFPALAFTCARLDDSGGDYQILIVDDVLVFRFPRDTVGPANLAAEIATLDVLQRRSPIPVPQYVYFDPAGMLAGYRFIEGVALTPARFVRLSRIGRATIVDAMAGFLSALHGLDPACVAVPRGLRHCWSPADFIGEGRASGLPLIHRFAPGLATAVAAFYDKYPKDEPHPIRILHGDLVGDHMLVTRTGSDLAGIIDFGDVGLGDPAQDFLFFWAYGEQVAGQLLQGYDADGRDPGLLSRSRWAYGRYRIDQFWHALEDGDHTAISVRASALADLLTSY